MAEQDLQQPQVPIDDFPTTGARLRGARERLGLSRADIAARTKIAERHLAAIEEERFADLASSTYAVGFSRAYARTVGLDEREIAQAVRHELELVDDGPAHPGQTFEPGDPARVPSSRTAWLAGAGVLAVIAGLLVFWGSYYFPAGSLPDLTSGATPAPSTPAAREPTPVAPAPAAQGPVVITSKMAGVWVKVTDENGKQLLQKLLGLGESYTVPADAAGPQLRTARPDALAITVGGRPVPPLADKPTVLTVPLSAAALLARGGAVTPAPVVPASTAPQAPPPAAAPSASASSVAHPAPQAKANVAPPVHPLQQAKVGAASPAHPLPEAKAANVAPPASPAPNAAASLPAAVPAAETPRGSGGRSAVAPVADPAQASTVSE